MSLKDWEAKYYAVPASSCRKQDAIKHSLTKWEGLKKSVLKKYKLTLKSGALIEDENATLPVFRISADTCALCRYHSDFGRCPNCPLYVMLRKRCDFRGYSTPSTNGPYITFIERDNPMPMIKELRKLRKQEEAKRERTRILRKNNTGR